MKRALVLVVAMIGCAKGGGGATVDASGGDGDGGTDGGSNAGATCPDGQFATNVDRAGNLTCAAPDDAAKVALSNRCQVYLGQTDSCNGCASPPAKWGEASTVDCSTGAGAGNTCTSVMLDAQTRLFGLDLDGNVNNDDKLYSTLHCISAPRPPAPAPCAPGFFVTGKAGDTWQCEPISEAAIDYVKTSCAVYTGWQDSCGGCTTAPAKWGFANDGGCTNGTGTDDTCVTAQLGGETVNLFGLNFDGDVDGNDKLHVGLHCKAPAGGSSALVPAAATACPAGQFVTGTMPDGSPVCTDPSALFQAYFAAHCSLYFGWRDGCDGGCTDPPAKWGVVHDGACTPGAGANDTCTGFTLGGEMIQMFGLATDGDVDGNDKLYFGLTCN